LCNAQYNDIRLYSIPLTPDQMDGIWTEPAPPAEPTGPGGPDLTPPPGL